MAGTRLRTAEFEKTRREYMQFSRRELPDVLNTKSFYIARRATVETPKADRYKLMQQIGPNATINLRQNIRILKNGTIKRGRMRGDAQFARARGREVARLALIINARRRKKGQKPLVGKELDKEVVKVWNSRSRSIAFLKSGWIPAIKRLEPLVKQKSGVAPRESSTKVYGKPKGRAMPARVGFLKTFARIENAASSKRDKKQALTKYGLPALQAAFDFETASMKQYIANRMAAGARKLRIRTA